MANEVTVDVGQQLLDSFQLVPWGDSQLYAMSAQDLWKRLGKPVSRFRKWWAEASKRQQLVEGEDFRVSPRFGAKPQGGRPEKDYLLTASAAKRVAASDSSDTGRAILRGLIDLEEKIQQGDPQLAAYIVSKMKDPEDLAEIASRAEQRAWRYWQRQGKTLEWFRNWWGERTKSILVRTLFTDVLRDHQVQGLGYARCTDATYQGLLGKTASQLRKELGLPKSKTPRDAMDIFDLVAVTFAENLAAKEIELANIQGNVPCESMCRSAAAKVRSICPQGRRTCR